MNENSKAKGDLAELKIATDLVEQGYYVSRPMTDNAPYDLIVDVRGVLKKVQIKGRMAVEGAIEVAIRSTGHNYSKAYEHGDFDILAFYELETGQIAYLTWEDISKSKSVKLRLEPPKNNQLKGVRMMEDYRLLDA